MANIILVTGGTRSGKSGYALKLAEGFGKKRLFLATAPRLDQEMGQRIARHQEERAGRGWQTVEEETDIRGVLAQLSPECEVVLLDCVTLWVNNILFSEGETRVNESVIAKKCQEWLDEAAKISVTLVCVSGEVGLGVVPESSLSRRYRDLVGTCNQLIARKAEKVVLVSCGIPLILKDTTKE